MPSIKKLHLVWGRMIVVEEQDLFCKKTNRHDTFYSTLTNTKDISAGHFRWVIGDIQNFKSKNIIFGRIGKLRSGAKNISYDSNKKKFIEEFLDFEKSRVL